MKGRRQKQETKIEKASGAKKNEREASGAENKERKASEIEKK